MNEQSESEHLLRLREIGFIEVGAWHIADSAPMLGDPLDDRARLILEGSPALYAHVVSGEVMYVGKTTQKLRKRLQGYIKPGNGLATNRRCHDNLLKALSEGRNAATFGCIPVDQMSFAGFRINLAAGLEDSIIERLSPPWNGGKGNEKRTESSEIEEDLSLAGSGVEAVRVRPASLGGFDIKLGKTYWNTGFMNPGNDVSHLLGKDGDEVLIQLGLGGRSIMRTIDRRANTNASPRIYGGAEVRDWWQRHFQPGAEVRAEIIGPNHIVLLPPHEDDAVNM